MIGTKFTKVRDKNSQKIGTKFQKDRDTNPKR
jgi:hypothetical protein